MYRVKNISRTGTSNSFRAGGSKRRGFTIVEVMMASIVMVLAITTSLTTMQRGLSSLDTARNITIAGQIMQCEMEKMRMKPWSIVSAYATGSATTETIDSSFTSNAFIGTRFTLTREVAVIDATAGMGMRQVTFNVSWKSYDGRTLSRSYTTYYGENGLYDYYYNSI
jgi:Tfp pilus assembly protein PilV